MRPSFLTILTVALIFTVLAPLGLLLRTQQPFNCFQMTYDENFFTQAIVNRAHGDGYRAHGDLKPYSPAITIGEPMAIGIAKLQESTRLDWPQAGRLFVYLCFGVLLWLIFYQAQRRSGGSSAAGVIAIGIFGWFVGRAPGAPYLVYGILGEIPAMLAAFYGITLLDRRRFLASGLLLALAYVIKPTFAFLLPSAALAALVQYGLFPFLFTSVGAIGGATYAWLRFAHARGETIPQYLHQVSTFAQSLTTNTSATLLDYYRTLNLSAGVPVIAMSVLIIGLGLLGLRRGGTRGRHGRASELAAGIFFLSGILFFAFVAGRPTPKHFFVFMAPGAAVVAVRLATRIGAWFSSWLGDARVEATAVAVVVTWIAFVPSYLKRAFAQADAHACPVLEERQVDRQAREIMRTRDLTPSQVAEISHEGGGSLFAYELGFNPARADSWAALAKISTPADKGTTHPRVVIGELSALEPLPPGCIYGFKGSLYALAECVK